MRFQTVKIIGKQIALMVASVANRKRGRNDVVHIVHVMAAYDELPIEQARTPIGKQVDIPQMRVPVQQGARQCLLMALQLRHTLTQLIAGSAQALYHFALEVLVIDLMLDREGNLFVHEARKRSFDMRFEECEIALEARALPVTCVQPSRAEEHTSELQSLMRLSYDVFCLTKT